MMHRGDAVPVAVATRCGAQGADRGMHGSLSIFSEMFMNIQLCPDGKVRRRRRPCPWPVHTVDSAVASSSSVLERL